MQRLPRWLGWLALAGFGLVVTAVIALVFYTRTESFRRWFEPRALAGINESIRGTISWDRLEGPLWRGVRLVNLQLRYQDRPIFTAASAELDYALVPLLWKQIRITRLAARQPRLDLRKQADGEWNVVQALSSGKPANEPFPWTVVIGGIALEQGELALRPVAGANDLYRLRQLNAAGQVRIADGLTARVERVASWLETPGTAPLYASGALSYRQAETLQSLGFEKFWLQTAGSRLMVDGVVKNFSDFDSDIRLQINRLAAGDIQRYLAEWPAEIEIAGTALVTGPGSALVSRFALQVAGAQLSGSARADLLGENKSYNADVALQRLALARILTDQKIAALVNAQVRISGTGLAIEALSGSGSAELQELVIDGRRLGAAKLQAQFRGREINFTSAIAGPLGTGSGRGALRLLATPTYEGEFLLRAVDGGALLQLQKAFAGKLNFDARVNGAGFDPATMSGRAAIDLLPSKLNQVSIQSGKILARVDRGQLQIDALRIEAPGASLQAEGALGIGAPQSGRVNYQLQVTDLAPWLDLFDRKGGGQLRLNGRAEGNFDRLQTSGIAALNDLRLAEGSARTGRIDFTLVRRAGAQRPSGTLKLDASGIDAAIDFARLRAAIDLPAPPARTISVVADGRDPAGRDYHLDGAIEERPTELLLRLRELALPWVDQTWRLAAPTTVTKRGDDLLIEPLRLRSGGAQLFAEGRVSLRASQALTVRADDVTASQLRGLWPAALQSSGVLSAQAQIGGSAAAPEISAAAQLGAGEIAGQKYQAVRARVDYRRQAITIDLNVDQDSAHRLEVSGTIPFALAWAPTWRGEALPGMNLRARSAGLSLVFLNALKLPLENITGQVALDLTIAGSLSDPLPRGSFQLIDGAFAVRDLGIRIAGVSAAASADERRLLLSRLSARANGGTLSGSGVVALQRLKPGELALELTARRWPAIATERYQADVDADLRIGGSLASPVVNGKVRLLQGSLRPQLALLEKSPVRLERDPTIVVVRRRGGAPIVPPDNGKAENRNGNGIWRALVLDVQGTIPNNLWVRHPNATVELAGNLAVNKMAESEPTLIGRIEAVRGWVGFQGRRFEISRGVVQFTGAQPINPTLDIVAEYRVNDYRVSAVTGGTARKPTLDLASQPQLAQSDILSLLLFGRPTGELNTGEQLSLQRSAIDIGAGFAASQLGKAVSGALGLDALGLDLSELTFSGGQVRFGRYIGSQTYFSVSQDIAGSSGREVALEYRLTPNLNVEASTHSGGNSGVDIIWRKRY